MPTHVPIVLCRRGKFKFPSEACAVHRTIGQVIADVDVQTAAALIARGDAALFVGSIPGSAHYLDQTHPQSISQRSARRQAEQDFLVRNIIANQ